MQQHALSARTPAHLWIVGALSLLWNGFGAYDYLMTRLHNMDYLASMGGNPQQMLDYVEGLPMYAQVGWGLGVWGSLLGSVLLLMRSRYSVLAFASCFAESLNAESRLISDWRYTACRAFAFSPVSRATARS